VSKDEDKVGIITHSMFGRCLSADGFDVEGQKLVNAKDFKNCQIYPCLNIKI
jgi:hypothetical protein